MNKMAVSLLVSVLLAVSSSHADELGALQILSLLSAGTPITIDSSGKHGHTIKHLTQGEQVILEQLLASQVKVARLSHIHSSYLDKNHTLGRSAAYILQWHKAGRYPLNLPNEVQSNTTEILQTYPIARLDLRDMNNKQIFSDMLLESAQQPVYISLISDFDAPCSGWIEGPNSDEEATSCEWLLTLDKCNPYDLFGDDIGEADIASCAPLLFISPPKGDAYNRVTTCKGSGYLLTGFYSIQYLESVHGRESYRAIPVQVDAERARETHANNIDQSCYSTPTH